MGEQLAASMAGLGMAHSVVFLQAFVRLLKGSSVASDILHAAKVFENESCDAEKALLGSVPSSLSQVFARTKQDFCGAVEETCHSIGSLLEVTENDTSK